MKVKIKQPALVGFKPPTFMDGEVRRKAVDAMVRMRKACRGRGIECPIDTLVPDDALFERMPPELLQNTLVMSTWPGVDVRIGGPEGKIQEGVGTTGKVYIFHDRRHVVEAAILFLETAAKNIESSSVQ